MRKQSPRLSHEGGGQAGLLASGFRYKFSVPGRQMVGIKRPRGFSGGLDAGAAHIVEYPRLLGSSCLV